MADTILFFLVMQSIKVPLLLSYVLLDIALERLPVDADLILLVSIPVLGAVYLVLLLALSWVWFLRTYE